MKITDDMVCPPTFAYLPSPRMMTYMINRASRAEIDPATGTYKFPF